ncbi:hypothetical protein BJ170DRAFT_677430 [Xylariales sp. AK1849]|nr:hypothetical protein BJ170DRAFT_677430 [Xylariales sp. AK1849]
MDQLLNAKTTPSESHTYYHALLRPAIIQILRAQGYHSSSPRTLDTLTELAGDYMTRLAAAAHRNAESNHGPEIPLTILDARCGLQDCGAIAPKPNFTSEQWTGKEDMRGIENFVNWFEGPKNAKINRMAEAFQQTGSLPPPEEMDGREEKVQRDYLSQLKQKHSKNDQDSKYNGTVLGKPIDHGEIMVEGGPVSSIFEWAEMMRQRQQRPPSESDNDSDSRPASSGLSSLTDGDVEMMDI